jgi:nucleotide-binding universal stress UspA family protein
MMVIVQTHHEILHLLIDINTPDKRCRFTEDSAGDLNLLRRHAMFKHILVPTDGSELSMRAAHQAIALAKALNAKITAFHSAPDYESGVYAGYAMEGFYLPEDIGKRVEENARGYVGDIEKACVAAGVPCSAVYVLSVRVSESILKACEQYGCDLIAMASHGHTGVMGVLLGSETQKVLAHAKVPVLVVR